MNDLRKAAEMALRRLDMYFVEHGNDDDFEATQALRQALAIEEQISLEYCDRCGWKAIAPPEGCLICDRKKWVGLTDEELGKTVLANLNETLWTLTKDIEAKLKEKNT